MTQFPVVISGDSITRLSEAHLAYPGYLVDAEDGRQAFTRGLLSRMSSNEASRLLTPMVASDGWFVFQDNAAGVSQADWRRLLQAIVSRLPDDRCLLGVLPVWISPADATTTLDIAIKANIMVEEFNAHPCVDYVRWNQKVKADPSLVYDGQHPTAAGAEWLANDIAIRTGLQIGGESCP